MFLISIIHARKHSKIAYPQIRRANGRLYINATLSKPVGELDIEVKNSAYVGICHESDGACKTRTKTHHIAGGAPSVIVDLTC